LQLFRELQGQKVARSKLVIALCRAGTEAEEQEARAFVTEAGFDVLPGALYERPAYRQAQNAGLTVSETRFPGLSQRVEELLQAMADRI
jgi:chromosome partitioning protein